MRTFAAGVLQRGPRRSQLGKVARPDSRGELSAGLAVIALVIELLVVPAAVAVSLVLLAVARVSRWRPDWLLLPMLVGVGWLAAAGPRWAPASVAGGLRQLVSGLRYAAADPSRLLRDPGGAAAAVLAWLPRELPAALVAGALQAGLLTWLGFRRRHETWRPGLLAASRRRRGRARLAAGQTVTGTGCALGLDARTGGLVGLSWAEAERGVLLTGTDPVELGPVVLAVACAALRRRKTVLTLDLGGGSDAAALAGAVALVAASLGLPVRRVSRPDVLGMAVGRAIRARGVLLSSGPGALLIGEVTGVLAWLCEQGLRGDSLVCLSGCEAVDPALLADMFALGPSTGTAMLASTTSAECAERLACQAGQTVVCGPLSAEVAARLIPPGIPADGGLSPDTAALARQRRGEFTLIGPGRTRLGCQAVPVMILGGPARDGPVRAGPRRAPPVPADMPTAAGR
jgi:hypothetical protein